VRGGAGGGDLALLVGMVLLVWARVLLVRAGVRVGVRRVSAHIVHALRQRAIGAISPQVPLRRSLRVCNDAHVRLVETRLRGRRMCVHVM